LQAEIMKDEVRDHWTKLKEVEFHVLCCSPNIAWAKNKKKK